MHRYFLSIKVMSPILHGTDYVIMGLLVALREDSLVK